MSDILLAEYEELKRLMLDQPWHAKCEIIRNYMPPFPQPDTQPSVQILYNDGTEHSPRLRYSHGPKQGFFWDSYGDDMQSVALAILALSQAPAPRYVGPITFTVPFRGSVNESASPPRTPNDCQKCGSGTCYCEIASNE